MKNNWIYQLEVYFDFCLSFFDYKVKIASQNLKMIISLTMLIKIIKIVEIIII